MSEPKLISPLLDGFAMGDAITDRGGIRTCPAIYQESGDKYIVKIISNPASQTQLDALLLTGAYTDREHALQYYESISQYILKEAEVLNKLSELDGFVACKGMQLVEAEDGSGYDVYLLTPYRKTLERYWNSQAMTHLAALNLGLDLCSALTVCRRCGFIYVALKPENIYMIEDKGFKIGDIGFIRLDSLKYASLPDRYRSAYTPPEIEDAFASISATTDVYAVGLILYQVFNGGMLPNASSNLEAPEFADYEMAEIILKAIAKNPEDRWQDPAQMGQALVGYMQRNGAHDTPIVPVPAPIDEPVQDEPVTDEVTEQASEQQEPQPDTEEAQQLTDESPVDTEVKYIEDDLGNLTFLTEDEEDVPTPEDVEAETGNISDEVSDILTQADELIAHEAPAPVVAPEPIEVQLPVEAVDENATDNEDANEEPTEDSQPTESTPEDDVDEESADTNNESAPIDPDDDYDDDLLDYEPKKKSHWLRNAAIILLILSLLAGGFVFYKFYYLQHIEALTLSGDDLSLTVYVNTTADETLLNVVCYDTYGNQTSSPVVNGKAVFDELSPDCAYTVKVGISGFHSLTGQVAVNYSTPKQTNIIQFNAITGAEDGSAVLSFSVDGPDLDSWIIRRSAADEQTEEFPCTEHTYTFTGLTIGKQYTFELLPGEDKQIIGTTSITHTASAVINAQNTVITSCQDGKLTVTWSAPADTQVAGWTIHCFNEKGYDQTLTTDQLTATFEGIITNDPYTVEITAAGMSIGQRVYVPENAVTISNFAITKSDATSITLGWTNGNNTPADGWILQYSIDGSPVKEVKTKNADSINITPYIPDSTYSFTLLTAESSDVIGGKLEYKANKSSDFSGYSIKRSNMTFSMCLTPNVSNWDRKDVRSSDYTTTFKAGQKASFVVRINKKYGISSNKINVTFVIRDSEGTVVNFSSKEYKWTNMWKNNYGEFDLPTLPKASGNYKVTVYFNNAVAGQEDFRIK